MSIGYPLAQHYLLTCPVCGRRQPDDGLVLECPEPHEAALLQTEYLAETLTRVSDEQGLYKYRNWLPITRTLPDAGGSVTYHSTTGLGEYLDLENLWIAFNGYWPERHAGLATATFKELEAYTVLGRLPSPSAPLVVSSAGNTAAAFATLCSKHQIDCVVVVPSSSLTKLRFAEALDSCVRLIALDQADYTDAITFGESISRYHGLQLEGGTKNVGRRDGLATVLYSAFDAMACLPDYYFQGIGSGAGAIAVHEAARRLSLGGQVDRLPRLMLCQNSAFSPVLAAWRSGGVAPVPSAAAEDRLAIEATYAVELTNRRPPYAVRGGLRDCLIDSRGDVLVADSESARNAAELFHQLEGIDVEPAAGVALACLRESVARGEISKSATVLLNVTGGGRARREREHALLTPEPDLHIDRSDLESAHAMDAVGKLIGTLASA